tara:strand:- start:9627 stop:10118 length:492 start_codon:yes stop_codon:yes gene_type:complete
MQGYGQTIYTTKKGHLKAVTKLNNTPVNAESHKLYVYLDYKTKQIKGTLDLRSLISNNADINNILNTDKPIIVNFSGTIPNNDFMSQPHEALTFNWLINVSIQNKNFDMLFNATIQHIEEGSTFSCRLSAFSTISVAETGLNELLPDIDKTIEIQFVQLILKL